MQKCMVLKHEDEETSDQWRLRMMQKCMVLKLYGSTGCGKTRLRMMQKCMVLKQSGMREYGDLKFENDVEMYGTQTPGKC